MQNQHRLPTHIKPEKYKIMLRPDLENFTFEGEETIYLTLERSTRQITLHCVDLEILSCEWVHRTKEIWAGKISYDQKAETATFRFPKQLETGKGELRLEFKGTLSDKMRGFYRSKYTVAGVDKYLATTQFESTDARRAFPCFDEPAQKAVFDVTLMIPPHMRAIGNTIESQILEHESGLKIVEFESTPKMSTYILAFLVGEFEHLQARTKDGVLVRVFTTPGKKAQAKFALEVGIKCLEFYNSYFGIDYPLPVLDMIAIPDFAAGAMENWGAVTYRESTLLIDEERSSTANKQWVALVIAHELAHMWFGNLVTLKWWTHLWLNEGFASFIEYLAIDHIFPDWDIWTQFVSHEMGVAFQLDALNNTHPIEVSVGHPAEISEIFDKVSYSKGASILRMLHEYLGSAVFQKGLQHYLKRHAYGNAQTEDLWQALEEISGKPVAKVMKNWTSKPGHPLVTVVAQGKKLRLTQSRFFSSPIFKRESKDKTIWKIPLRTQASPGRLELLDKKTINIDKPKDGQWLKLNSGEVSFVRVDYPYEYLKKLETAIKNGHLSAPDRLGLIRDSFDLAQSGNSPTTLALELAQSYVGEEDYTVWSALTNHISQLDSLFALEPFYEDFKKYGRRVYSPIANKMGWEKKKDEKHTDTLLREIVLNMLGSFGDEGVIKKAQELFYFSRHPERLAKDLPRIGKIASSKTPRNDGVIDPDLKGVVYNLVAGSGGQDEFGKLIRMYKEEDNQQEKERLGRALGQFKNASLLKKTLEFSTSQYVRYQNTLGIISAVWRNPKGRYLAWEFVKKKWKLLKDRYAGGHYFTKVFQPAGEFTKVSDAKDIASFVRINPTPETKRTIAQALEQIYSNAEWLKRDREGIKKFLTKVVHKIRSFG